MYAFIDRFFFIFKAFPSIVGFFSLVAIPSLIYIEFCYHKVSYEMMIIFFVFVTIYVIYSTQAF